jgi:signal transduction histidine kinase
MFSSIFVVRRNFTQHKKWCMNSFFRKLPLSYKLMLIGIIPIVFLIYLSAQLYVEKGQRVTLISNYIDHIHESGNIANLINELENERKYSYEYGLKKKYYSKVLLQRPRTDSVILLLKKSTDPALTDFSEYTFLNDLESVRKALDTAANYSANSIMEYYTKTIFRLNTLNTVPSASNIYLRPVIKDFIAQKKLFDMITFMGVIRTYIYNALYTRQNVAATLLSGSEFYNAFKTYEAEFLLKARDEVISQYKKAKATRDLKNTLSYIDKAFTTLNLDTTYTSDEWWQISSRGKAVLKSEQSVLWNKAESGMKKIYNHETSSKTQMLVFLITAIILVITLVIYTIRVITNMLMELKVAAERISIGATGLHLNNMSNDVMGSLSQSILKIEKNNLELAYAANAIGSGNFDVEVKPRGDEDLLGNSIKRMKDNLHQFTLEKDKVQQETLELMHRKDDFLSIASHELKTPVTSLKAYAQLLQMDAQGSNDTRKEVMFAKMDAQVDKLTALINDLLDTSKMQNGKLIYNKISFRLNDLVKEIITEMQTAITSHIIILEEDAQLEVCADRDRVGQVVNNLLSNAIKYCPDCKKLVVAIEKGEQMAVCSVQDFGNGINKEQQHKIFERFYRVTGKNFNTYPGLGLGLYIAKEIVDRHNGRIWFESEIGKGTTFYFSLPLAKAATE